MTEYEWNQQDYDKAAKRMRRNIKEENAWLVFIFTLIVIGAAIWGYYLFS